LSIRCPSAAGQSELKISEANAGAPDSYRNAEMHVSQPMNIGVC